jgi:hypothetical protein
MTDKKKRTVKKTVKVKRRKADRHFAEVSGTDKRVKQQRGYVGKRKADETLAHYVDTVAGSTKTEMALALDKRYQKVWNNLETEEGQMLKAELEKEIAHAASRVRHKALAYFEDFLDDLSLAPSLRLQALKFALQNLMTQSDGPAPDELVFETMISTTGNIEKTSRKIYKKQSVAAEAFEEIKDAVFDVEVGDVSEEDTK